MSVEEPESAKRKTVRLGASSCSAGDGAGAGTNKNVPYNPFMTNSNATVRTLLERVGIRGVKPIVWAPGWSTRLFDCR